MKNAIFFWMPVVAIAAGVLPSGYTVRRFRGVVYYGHGGVCYRRQPHGFVVVHPPW